MEELIERIERRVGVAPETARKSIAAFLTYFDRNGPKERMAEFYQAVPDAVSLVGKRRGGILGVFSNGLMSIYAQLTAAGFSIEQMQMAGEEVIAFAREKVGDDAVEDLIAETPGIRQLL
jgi:hypothetical protein